MIALAVCASSVGAQAAILQDNSERRIQIRQGTAVTSNYSSNSNQALSSDDRMQGLIKQNSANIILMPTYQ